MPSPQVDSYTGATFNPAIALDPTTVERALLAALKASAAAGSILNQVEISHFPERPENYRLTHRVGAVLLIWKGAEYGELMDTDPVIQERTLKWEIDIIMRDLGWAYGGQPSGPSPGAYQMIEAVRGVLMGLVVQGFRPMYPSGEEYGKRGAEGAWYYSAEYRHTTIAIQQSATPNYALLTELQALEEAGQTNTPVAPAPYTFDGSGNIHLPYINIQNLVVTNLAGSITYIAGTDYSLNNETGVIARIPAGAIGAGATVEVAYSYADVVTAVASGGAAPMQPTN